MRLGIIVVETDATYTTDFDKAVEFLKKCVPTAKTRNIRINAVGVEVRDDGDVSIEAVLADNQREIAALRKDLAAAGHKPEASGYDNLMKKQKAARRKAAGKKYPGHEWKALDKDTKKQIIADREYWPDLKKPSNLKGRRRGGTRETDVNTDALNERLQKVTAVVENAKRKITAAQAKQVIFDDDDDADPSDSIKGGSKRRRGT